MYRIMVCSLLASVAFLSATIRAATIRAAGGVEVLLIGGDDAEQTDWVGRLESSQGGCTVTLIHPEWILTASHCVTEVDLQCKDKDCISDSVYSAEVYIGGTDAMFSGEDGEVRTIDYVAIPDGDASGSLESADIALLHLNRPVDSDQYPEIREDRYDGRFSMMGYGKDGNDQPVLQRGDNIQQTNCDADLTGYICYELNDYQAQSDHGDSGGPAFITDSSGKVTIIGTILGRIRTLGANIDISYHDQWIQTVLKDGPTTCKDYCSATAMNSNEKCGINAYTKCDDICLCETPRPTRTATPSRKPDPVASRSPARTPSPTKEPDPEPTQTSNCDYSNGQNQAEIQWNAWRYIEDCDKLEDFKTTVLKEAPDDLCQKTGFELEVEKLYEEERAQCDSQLPPSSCDYSNGENQAEVQWNTWRYLEDCSQLEDFKKTVLNGAPDDPCQKEGFELKVEELYEEQRAQCDS